MSPRPDRQGTPDPRGSGGSGRSTGSAGPLFEVAPREDTRSPVAGRPARPWRSVWALLPAAVLVGVMLAAPLVATVITSLHVAGSGFFGFGLDHYAAIWHDGQVRHAVANSLRWLAIAPLVCVVGFALAQLGRNARRSRAFLVGVVAAPMAVSALTTGVAFRLLFAPQPDQGIMTALASAAGRAFGETSPLPGAHPDPAGVARVDASGQNLGPLGFTADTASGDLTTEQLAPGQAVDLALTGVPTPAIPPLGTPGPPVGTPGEVSGVVTVRDRPVGGIPVSIHRLGFAETTHTDQHGYFHFDVSDQPAAAQARYTLDIPASAIAPQPAGVAFLGPGWIGWVLGSAFTWGWMGFALVVFRAGLAGVPANLQRMARAFGAGRLRTALAVTVPALMPVTAVVLLTLLVAAARVFDLVLVGAPGSMQADADVIGLRWWRSRDLLGSGGAAALAVLLFLLVTVFALGTLWLLNHEWPSSPPVRGEPDATRSPARRWGVRAAGLVAMALWLVPFLELLLTSLRSGRDAAVAGWWVPGRDGLGLDSYRAAFASGELGSALVSTAGRATLSTVLLVLVAVPAAHSLACGPLSARTSRVLITVTAVLAVVPVQAVADPLQRAFNQVHVFGAPTLLTLIHVAFGVPFAVLLLRPVFRAIPRRELLRGRLGGDAERASSLRTVVNHGWTTILAVAVLEFVFVWNDLVVGLILSGPRSGSIMLALVGQAQQFATSAGVVAAGAVVSMLVPLAVVLATGRWVVRGLVAGVLR